MMERHAAQRLLLTLCGLACLAGTIIAIFSRFVLPFRPRLKHLVIDLPRRHAQLGGTTIAFVTDTHVGPHFAAGALTPIASTLREVQPDIVLFGGDYISESPRFMEDAAPALGAIAATARFGSWGILGNHDLSNIPSRIAASLEAQGIRMLVNDAACVALPGGELWFAGVDDAILGRPDLDRVFHQIPADVPTILLWHEPDLAHKAAPYGAFLQLSGHSHGGQVRIPLIGAISAPVLGRRFVQGRFRISDTTLYVSNGIGMYRPPVRFNCPPEVTLIHLIG